MKKGSLAILFVGNSHTYLHHMPLLLAALVQARGRGELAVDQVTGNGVSLQWHWNNPNTREKIREGRWDYVVLQDRSGGPLEELKVFQAYARRLDEEIGKHGARTIFFMTWANKSRPQTQAALADAYRRMARELGALLAPVGLAWEKALSLDPALVLHHKDGRHASATGAYLTACVFYAVLLKASPAGLPATLFIGGKKRLDLDRNQALFLQQVAFETVGDAKKQ